MRRTRIAVCILTACLTLGGVALAQVGGQASPPAAATATVPRLIQIRGTARGEAGKPLIGNIGVTFTLYSDADGQAVVWQENQNVQLDSSGHYSVLLGATSDEGLPLEIFSAGEARWLGVRPDGQAEQPRILLLSVAYALKAADTEMLGGKPASAYALADSLTSAQQVSNIQVSSTDSQRAQILNVAPGAVPLIQPATTCTGITSDGNAATNAIAYFTGSCNIEGSSLFQSGSNVGIAGQLFLPAISTATASQGFNSNPLDLQASSFSSTSSSAVEQDFRLQAEPTGSDSTSPSGTLNLLFGSNGGSPTETGFTISSTGAATMGGAVVTPSGTAISAQGFNSNPVDLQASVFNATLSKAVNYLFQWQAEPVNNNTTNTAASLNLQYGVTGAISETGLSIAKNGIITFASGQTFPGGTGITGVTAGSGLTGGGTSGTVTVSIISCTSSGQILLWNGTTWTCGASSGSLSGTTDGIAYFSSSTSLTSTAAPTNGQLLIGSTGGAPVLKALTAGTNVTITNAPGSITISASGSGGGSPTLPFFATGGGRTGIGQPAGLNLTKVWGFLLPYNVTTTEVIYDATTADNTANDYDVGIYNNSGNLVVDLGAIPGTTFAPSKAFHTLKWTQGSTALAAGRYYLALTTNCKTACAQITGTSAYMSFAVGLSVGATSGGALPSTITPPADTWATGDQPTVVIQ